LNLQNLRHQLNENTMATRKTYKFAGRISIAGAVSMLIGAACWGVSGTDLWQALSDNDMENYLLQLSDVKTLLVLNTSFWVLGVLLMATAASIMADICQTKVGLAQMAKVFARTGGSIAVVSFIIMLSLAINTPGIDTATNTGWIGVRLDDIATMLIIGYSPLCLSIAGKIDWVPGWLYVWGYLAGIAGLIGIIGLFTEIVALGFIIIPFGIGWMIAAGIVLIRKSRTI
jgi:hypothetical protein